eukprot:m.233581 g.233581  ORF g.233581 m.233581 type:complete len:190 (-) comp19218_c0_seq1:258-827(-)
MDNTGFIAGVAAGGGVILITICAFIAVHFVRKRRNPNNNHNNNTTTTQDKDIEALPSYVDSKQTSVHSLDLPSKSVTNPVYDGRSSPSPNSRPVSEAIVPVSPIAEAPEFFSPSAPLPAASPLPPTSPTPTATTTLLSPEAVSPSAGDDEARAARIKAMKEARAKRKDNEWQLVHDALQVIDSLPGDDD